MDVGYVDNEVCPDCGEWILILVTEDGVATATHICGEIGVKMRGVLKEYGEDGEITIRGEFG